MADQKDEATKTKDLLSDESKGTPPRGSSTTSKDSKQKKGDTVTLSKKEYDDIVAESGRRKKLESDNKLLQAQLDMVTKRLDDVENRSRSAAYESARSDPDALKAWERDEVMRKREIEAQKREDAITIERAKLDAEKAEVEQKRRELTIPTIAAKYNLKSEDLAGLDNLDEAALDVVASRLATRKPAEGDGGEDGSESKETGEWENFEPADAVSSGQPQGGQDLTPEKVEKMPMEALEATLAPKPK